MWTITNIIGGSRGGAPSARPPKGPNSFVLTYKILKRNCLGSPHPLLRGPRPPLREILDPPLNINFNLVTWFWYQYRLYSNWGTQCQDQILRGYFFQNSQKTNTLLELQTVIMILHMKRALNIETFLSPWKKFYKILKAWDKCNCQ